MFDKILNWKLLSGSHEFPGPDGGTCINEAAIVAAGFKYRSVADANDCPRCFSRPIAAFAIALNDNMASELRQELLMPFVCRLAGTRDREKVEVARAKLIVFRTIRDVLPIVLRGAGLFTYAEGCAASKNFDAARRCIIDHRYAAALHHPITEAASRYAAKAAACLVDDDDVFGVDAIDAVEQAANSIDEVAAQVAVRWCVNSEVYRTVFVTAASILDEAIRLGRQASPIETATIVARLEAAKQSAPEPETVA